MKQTQRHYERSALLSQPQVLSVGRFLLAVGACLVLMSCALLAQNELPGSPLNSLKPLTRQSDPQEIQARMQQSSAFWQTLRVTTQRTDFGPIGYIGPERRYEDQLWLQQPGQSLIRTGAPGSSPVSAALVGLGTRTEANLVTGELQSEAWNGSVETLVQQPALQAMLFPSSGEWMTAPGRLEVIEDSVVAERKVIIADWFNSQGHWRARLWIDAISGLVLRQQIYSGDADQLLLSDSQVTAIDFDAPIDSSTFDLHNVWKNPAAGEPAIQPGMPAATAQPGSRPRLELEAAPLSFDPANSRLQFQLASEASQSLSQVNQARAPFELFADGYFIGKLDFGLPWGLRCARSPDGQRLAYTTAGDELGPADQTLRWFNLTEPQLQYEPLAGLAVTDFTFSPDPRWLAAFGRSSTYQASGLYLVDIGLGESQHLHPLWQARGLRFSPDGSQLALVGKESDQAIEQAMLFDIASGQLIFSAPLTETGVLPVDWPAQNWSAGFPAPIGGMEACALPLD
jgi:hypothetical protein